MESHNHNDEVLSFTSAGRYCDGLTENAGHDIAGHEIAGQNHVRPTLHYYKVCISCLLLLFS